MDAVHLIACLDLTNLNDDCTEADITELCQNSVTRLGSVAAICIYPRFLNFARKHCPQGVALATVINFPGGGGDVAQVLNEVRAAVIAGADELDLVIAYEDVLRGDLDSSLHLLDQVKLAAPDCLIKVILETGILVDPQLILRLSEALLVHGADFLKTSTGKVPVGATIDAVEAMLQALLLHKVKTGVAKGLKISGGVRTVEQVEAFVKLAQQSFGDEYLRPRTFRIGASGLLNDILRRG